MKKRTIAAAVLAVAIAGVIWNKVDGLTQNNAETETSSPSASPSSPAAETDEPSESSSIAPSDEPSEEPTEEPSEEPSATPDPKPSDKPSEEPEQPSDEDQQTDDDFEATLAANLPENNVKVNDDGVAVVTNVSSQLAVVNKKRELPSTYSPKDLVVPDVAFSFSGDSPKKKMRKVAANALEDLFAGAKKDGITLKAVSGYRSYATQKALFQSNADKKGEEVANRTSARAGQSEHQTGLAMDVSSSSAGYALEETFADTKEGKWLAKHAADYGFIIRFLKGKEKITGYSYEPWHIRYVGKDAAEQISDQNITLEEYFEAVSVSLNK